MTCDPNPCPIEKPVCTKPPAWEGPEIRCSAPEPVCQEGEFCDCWHMPPGSPWLKAECPAGQTCEAKKCVGGPPPPPPPPPPDPCPKELAAGAVVYLNDKPQGHGFDSTPRVWGDPEFCFLIHGVRVEDCNLEGWPRKLACELELVGGCPEWQYSARSSGAGAIVCHDDRQAPASCDHFGTQDHQDDPQTPTTGNTLETLKGFEGMPRECGLQRDELGPRAGYFTVAHGAGYVRACPVGATLAEPSDDGPGGKPKGRCGPWRAFDH